MHRLTASLAAAGIIAVIATPALGAGASVKVDDDFFRAKTVRITKGSTVTWRWVGSRRHDVVGKGFKSKLQTQGTYKHRFAKKGTYRYVCSLHADRGMKGKVIVR
jgi:plastocyanin